MPRYVPVKPFQYTRIKCPEFSRRRLVVRCIDKTGMPLHEINSTLIEAMTKTCSVSVVLMASNEQGQHVKTSLYHLGGKQCTWPDPGQQTLGNVLRPGLFTLDGETFITCGGSVGGGIGTNKCWIYNKVNDQWENNFNMQISRYAWFGVQLDEHKYWILGSTT